jgi:kynureninase
MVQPILVPAPPTYVLQPKPFPPKRNYRVRDAEQPAPIIGAAANDLMAYPHTRNALIKALEAHYTVAGPLREHTVIIEANDWIGEFTIESNVNADRLTLLLVEGAVPAQMDERPPMLAWA